MFLAREPHSAKVAGLELPEKDALDILSQRGCIDEQLGFSRPLALQLITHRLAAFIVDEDKSSVLHSVYPIDTEAKIEPFYLERSLLLRNFDCERLSSGALHLKPIQNETFKSFALRDTILLVKRTFPIVFYSLCDRLADEYTEAISGCRTKASLCLKLLPHELQRLVE
jgi:hypothetical protein